MSFRPSTGDRLRHAWTQHHPDRQTLSRAAVLACLALGAIGGVGQIATSCSSEDVVNARQLDSTLNRATSVGGFADAYVNVFLAGRSATALAAFTSAQIKPSPVPVSVIKTAPWSVTRQSSGFANVDYWSVVIGAFVKPISKAPELRFYQVPVVVVQGLPRASTAPAFINGPDIGYDADLNYPSQVSQDSDAYSTVTAFLGTWLKGTAQHPASGDISRYSVSPQIQPFDNAPFTNVTVDSIDAQSDIPADAKNGFTTKILVTAEGSVDNKANQTLTYPLVMVRQSDKWFISDIDLTPQLGGRITKPTATQPTTPTPTPTK
ncbi:conjugal transfer protein [Candidatus Mycobacterium methanotrophicum]|uniref:Conjugal transfer protein n=1 Tax=Candidatus Mycobacterium methanotrophicum TaxID=2943498 RepID=A0ABY4QRG9_9MYCO|nr:conjugal transfer protein [Candidatus Mycobacterium methanotrophicum]UQX13543.1 conjugal transfer protein [Candidatus Mycobacterium methanotrophicum]